MRGATATEETAHCLLHNFQKSSIGAERSVANCDGAMLTYDLLMFLALQIRSKNPKRCFKPTHSLSHETEHSRLEADSINKQINDQYNEKSQLSKTKDRVDYLKDKTDLQMFEMTHFPLLP